jgi:streptogramin lyase
MTIRREPIPESDLRRFLARRAEAVAGRSMGPDALTAAVAARVGLMESVGRTAARTLRIVLVAGLIILALAAALLLVGSRRDPYRPDAPSVTAAVQGAPWAVGAADGAIWVAGYREPVLTRIEPGSGRVIATYPLPERVCGGIETGFGYLWMASCGGQTLFRFDVARGRTDRLSGGTTDRVAIGAGSVWTSRDTVVRLDPLSLAEQASIGRGGSLLAFGGDRLWAAATDAGVVEVIDPTAERVIGEVVWPVPAGQPVPVHLVADGEAAHVVDEGLLRVVRIDAVTHEARILDVVLEPIDGTGFGDHYIARGGGEVWVRVSATQLARLDPVTGRILERLTTPDAGGGAFAISDESIWVANMKTGTIDGIRRP